MIVLKQSIYEVKKILRAARCLVSNKWYDEARFQNYLDASNVIWYVGYQMAIPCVVAACMPCFGSLCVCEVQAFVSGKEYGKSLLKHLASMKDGILFTLKSDVGKKLFDYICGLDFLASKHYVEQSGMIHSLVYSKNLLKVPKEEDVQKVIDAGLQVQSS